MRPGRVPLGILVVLLFAAQTRGSSTGPALIESAVSQAESIVDIDGGARDPFKPASVANALFFVATDCPISNAYAPAIQQICLDYRSRGISCFLIYEDLANGPSGGNLNEEVRKHLREYRYAGIPALIDRTRAVAGRAKASITPQAVVIDRESRIRYRGRIDNWYVSFGKRRQTATEHDLRDALDAVLEGRRVRKVETEALGCYIADPASLRK
jgi:thiol-disulfide isomerase/thioredoxin